VIIIPAIDIKQGRCVRLIQGRMEKETVYSDFPHEVAKRWQMLGAERLHIVDLDGAICGLPKNVSSISKIIESIDIPIQVGGGIRDIDTIKRYIDMGVEWVILGTVALENKTLLGKACKIFPERIIVSIDAVEGKVAIKGWKKDTKESVLDVAKRMEEYGVFSLIFTDIKRDGMLSGPNIDAIEKLANSISISIIASGGVTTLDDIKKLKRLESVGVSGVIIGKALYERTIDLKKAIEIAKTRC